MSNRRMARIPVPGPEEPWWTAGMDFALTFNAYERTGNADRVAALANKAAEAFATDGSLPNTIDAIRTCLFFEQRRWRHFDADPYGDPATKTYLQALLAELTRLTGGFVDGPADSFL